MNCRRKLVLKEARSRVDNLRRELGVLEELRKTLVAGGY